MSILKIRVIVLYIIFLAHMPGLIQAQNLNTKTTKIGEGWAGNSVNVVNFRQNSITSFQGTQYTAWYNQDKFVMLGKRKTGDDKWEIIQTQYQGNIYDAHNTISIMVDGIGYLHISWDHHNNELRYARSKVPGSIELSEKMPMTGSKEEKVSYPQFFRISGGNLLFLYRDGASGQGNLVVNKYEVNSQKWSQLHNNLIDGEGLRNAYWQAYADNQGKIHISWVWRESPDVASNHDLCYASSSDGGITWEKSTGEKYTLPITATNAEYINRIPQKSELINQTSMSADNQGNPIIASYWRESNSTVPQYHVVFLKNNQWKTMNLDFRKAPFSLSGVGSKSIPISRPQILLFNSKNKTSAFLIFRDEERGSKASMAIVDDIGKNKWEVFDLTRQSLGSWEPTFDTDLWKEKNVLNLFIQNVTQIDNEGKADVPPQPIEILEWRPVLNK